MVPSYLPKSSMRAAFYSVIGAFALTLPVAAQDTGSAADDTPVQVQATPVVSTVEDTGSIFTVAPSRAESYLDLGAAVLTRPAYLGSEEQLTNIYPYIGGEYKGRLFLNPAQGAGLYLINKEKLQVTTFATLASGRDAEETGLFDGDDSLAFAPDSPGREAAEDALELKTSVLASAGLRYRFKYALLDIAAALPVTGDAQGFRTEVGLATKIPYEPFGIAVFPGVRATFTSDDWNNVYYGIDAAQSAATGLDTFEVDGGLSALGATAFVTWDGLSEMLSENLGGGIQVIGVANYSWIQGDLKDSPLTPKDKGLLAVVGVAKRF